MSLFAPERIESIFVPDVVLLFNAELALLLLLSYFLFSLRLLRHIDPVQEERVWIAEKFQSGRALPSLPSYLAGTDNSSSAQRDVSERTITTSKPTL